VEANTKEDSVKMNEYEGLTEMLVEMASKEVGASVGLGVVVLDGSRKVMVGTDKESEMELERGTTMEVGSGGADEEGTVGTGGASEEEGGEGMMLDKGKLTVLIISPGFEEKEGAGGGVGIMLEITELRVSPMFGEEEGGGVDGLEEAGASEADVVAGRLAIWLVTSLTTELRALVRSPMTLVRPPRRPPSEEVSGGVIEAESNVEESKRDFHCLHHVPMLLISLPSSSAPNVQA